MGETTTGWGGAVTNDTPLHHPPCIGSFVTGGWMYLLMLMTWKTEMNWVCYVFKLLKKKGHGNLCTARSLKFEVTK